MRPAVTGGELHAVDVDVERVDQPLQEQTEGALLQALVLLQVPASGVADPDGNGDTLLILYNVGQKTMCSCGVKQEFDLFNVFVLLIIFREVRVKDNFYYKKDANVRKGGNFNK